MSETLDEDTADRPIAPVLGLPAGTAHRLVLVTGLSGAGRSTIIAALEDLGAEAIDNLPLSLVPRLIEGPPLGRPLALGIDVRTRGFSATGLIDLVDQLTQRSEVVLEVVFVEASTDVLARRYSETRRRHPLAPDDPPVSGIIAEADLLVPIRARADLLIDTSEMSPHDLRAEIVRWYGATPDQRMAVSVQSFSYKRGLPRGVDMVFDCRFLSNPYWVPELRSRNGLDAAVAAHVGNDPRFGKFINHVHEFLIFVLAQHLEEGKSHLSIAFGCTGGQHRSVAVAEKLGDMLIEDGWHVARRHRELERRPAGPLSNATKG